MTTIEALEEIVKELETLRPGIRKLYKGERLTGILSGISISQNHIEQWAERLKAEEPETGDGGQSETQQAEG